MMMALNLRKQLSKVTIGSNLFRKLLIRLDFLQFSLSTSNQDRKQTLAYNSLKETIHLILPERLKLLKNTTDKTKEC